jgi:hypothetical protein
MGQMRNAAIAAWQKAAGIKEATGQRAELLSRMSAAAFELIKVIELERSGIRDGDGGWSGSDAMGGTARDMAALCNEWCSPKYDYDDAVTQDFAEDNLPF